MVINTKKKVTFTRNFNNIDTHEEHKYTVGLVCC